MSGGKPSGDWPRAYILQLYQSAIDHGFVWVTPISAPKAASLRASFNRIRRPDPALAGLLTDQMRLVGMGGWQPGPASDPAAGKVPVIYSLLPSGDALPSIIPGEDGQQVTFSNPTRDLDQTPPLDPAARAANTASLLADPTSLQFDDAAISSFVGKMLKDSSRHD